MDPYNQDTLFIPNGAHIIGIHINQDTLLMTGNVGHFESRAIAQAQEEGHGGGYIAMTLTFKMATTGKWTNLTQKVAKVKLFECNH